MHYNRPDIGIVIALVVAMGVFVVMLFGRLARRDTDDWQVEYEKKAWRITHMVFSALFALSALAMLILTIVGWDNFEYNQKVSYFSGVMVNCALSCYALRFRKSPRSVWVKIRKVFAYIIVVLMYFVWPATVQQFLTGNIPVILMVNVIMYGIGVLIVWLLLRHYKKERYVGYKRQKLSLPEVENNTDFSESIKEGVVDSPNMTNEQTSNSYIKMCNKKSEWKRILHKSLWWLFGLLLLGAIVAGIVVFVSPNQTKKHDVGLNPFKDDNGKWGYFDKSGWVILPQFDEAWDFSEGLARVRMGGKEVDICEGLRVIGFGSKFGYINEKGFLVINPQFDYAMDFSDGLARVRIDDKWGYINKKGDLVINPQFHYAHDFSEGLARVEGIDGNYGYINKKGEWAINPQFEHAGDFSEGLARVVIRVGICDKEGFINKKGDWVINPQFDDYSVSDFSDGLARVVIDGKCGYINKKGEWVINPQFRYACDFSEGLARVVMDDKYGYINKKGQVVITPHFDDAGDFSEGLARVEVGGKIGYINKKGCVVINPQYDDAGDFSKGLALVVVGDKMEYINKKGSRMINLPANRPIVIKEPEEDTY